MSAGGIQEFLYVFFPFLFGVYPYTTATEKQKKAMELAGITVSRPSIGGLVQSFVAKMLAPAREGT